VARQGVFRVDSGRPHSPPADNAGATLAPSFVRVPYLLEIETSAAAALVLACLAQGAASRRHGGRSLGSGSRGPDGAGQEGVPVAAGAHRRAAEIEREFIECAAHELRAPVASILSLLQVIARDEPALPDDVGRLLRYIAEEADVLAKRLHTATLMARARLGEEELDLEPIPLRPLLERVAATVRLARGVDVEVACPAGLAALADHDLVVLLLSNLAENAAKHTQRDVVSLAARAETSRAVIEVMDRGPGIELGAGSGRSPERALRNGEGLGLGLVIVGRAVAALGGTLELQSEPGSGTVAHVTLPLAWSGEE